jgi:hypothetical protein
MSLLLFALLNAIRAYFVSPSLRRTPSTPPGPALPRRFLDFPAFPHVTVVVMVVVRVHV